MIDVFTSVFVNDPLQCIVFTSGLQSALTYAEGDHPQKHFAGVEKAVRGI